jgi:hypothetical protein
MDHLGLDVAVLRKDVSARACDNLEPGKGAFTDWTKAIFASRRPNWLDGEHSGAIGHRFSHT